MNDSQLEARIRDWYRSQVGDDGAPYAVHSVIGELSAQREQPWTSPRRWRPAIMVALGTVVVVGAIALYAFAPGLNPGTKATPLPTAGPSIDLSAGVPHQLTPQAAERVVLQLIKSQEDRVGRAVVPARVTQITLLAPREFYDFGEGTGSRQDGVSWAVRFEGTYLSCRPECDLYTGGTIILNDEGVHVASGLTGPAGKLTGDRPYHALTGEIVFPQGCAALRSGKYMFARVRDALLNDEGGASLPTSRISERRLTFEIPFVGASDSYFIDVGDGLVRDSLAHENVSRSQLEAENWHIVITVASDARGC